MDDSVPDATRGGNPRSGRESAVYRRRDAAATGRPHSRSARMMDAERRRVEPMDSTPRSEPGGEQQDDDEAADATAAGAGSESPEEGAAAEAAAEDAVEDDTRP